MPLTVSVSALALRLFGASHCRAVPLADQIARLRLGDLQRQQRLGTKRILDLLVGHERRGSAEVAAPADDIGDRRPKSPGSSGSGPRFGGLPAARRVRNGAQRRDEVVLDDHACRRRASVSFAGDSVPQNGQIERLLRRIPVRLGAARGTVEFLAGGRRPGRSTRPRQERSDRSR